MQIHRKVSKEGPGLVKKKEIIRHPQVGKTFHNRVSVIPYYRVSPPQARNLEESYYWPGEHLGAGCPVPRKGPGRKRIFQARAFPPASLPFLTKIVTRPKLCPSAQPPVSGACALGPGWGWPQGKGLVSRPGRPSLTSARTLQPPAQSQERRGRRAPTWAVSHAVPAPESLRVPDAGRPSPPQALDATAAPPAPAPAPPRPAGGRDLVLLGSFR